MANYELLILALGEVQRVNVFVNIRKEGKLNIKAITIIYYLDIHNKTKQLLKIAIRLSNQIQHACAQIVILFIAIGLLVRSISKYGSNNVLDGISNDKFNYL